jgi:predicted DNA-binding transcriptional regulator AlpA
MSDVSQSTLAKRPTLPRAVYRSTDVCGLLEISYTKLMEQLKAGTFPVEPIRIGREYRFPKADIDRLIRLESE